MDKNTALTRMLAIGGIIIVAVGAFIYSVSGKKSVAPADTTTATSVATSSDAVATASTSAATSVYKDGQYQATGSYLSPGGDEKMGVTLTLKNDVITDASVQPAPVSDEGKRYQEVFAANFKPLVVGKNISEVQLGTVSGSSLTPKGFNDALSQIEAKAKA